VRLLIVTDAWLPQINGVVRTLTTLGRKLCELGHDVAFVTPDGFRSVPCPTYPEIRLALATPGRVGAQIRQFDPDAVHIATEGPLGWAARSWLRRHRLPFTTAFHTLFPHYLKLRFGLPERLTFAALRCFHGSAAATLCSTPTLQDELLARGFANLTPWARGVDTDLFAPGEPADLPYQRPIQLYVGRVAVEKNLPAFLGLDTPGTKVVIGDGPARPRLQARYPDAHFLGSRHGADLVGHYRAADVFVFPSRSETFGLVMLEALACGVPVAAYPVRGPLDIIGDSGAGVLHDDLAEATARALGIDRALCRDQALTYAWGRSVRQFLDNLAPIAGAPFTAQRPERPVAGSSRPAAG
jgi:glycosyltransferase involved in cell wall biosynthesis